MKKYKSKLSESVVEIFEQKALSRGELFVFMKENRFPDSCILSYHTSVHDVFIQGIFKIIRGSVQVKQQGNYHVTFDISAIKQVVVKKDGSWFFEIKLKNGTEAIINF